MVKDGANSESCGDATGGCSRGRLSSREHAGLSPLVEKLLRGVAEDGFTLYRCGPKAVPNALVACYHWGDYVDLLTVGDFDRVITARVPTPDAVDIFAPEVVVWAYEGQPQYAIRALLNLVHPAHPNAPTTAYAAPARLRVPRAQQRPMTIQLPTPSRANARAARLTSSMTSHGHGWPSVENEQPPTLGSRRPVVPQPADEAEAHHAR